MALHINNRHYKFFFVVLVNVFVRSIIHAPIHTHTSTSTRAFRNIHVHRYRIYTCVYIVHTTSWKKELCPRYYKKNRRSFISCLIFFPSFKLFFFVDFKILEKNLYWFTLNLLAFGANKNIANFFFEKKKVFSSSFRSIFIYNLLSRK